MRLPPGLSRDDVVAKHRRFVWPPYTRVTEHETREPLVLVSAHGAWLEDADGKTYLDGNASWWTALLGHRHPRLVRALVAQAEAMPHVALAGATHAQAALLAEELVAVAPKGLTRAHFSDDGSTSVEVAVKTAVQYWAQTGRPERTRFVALAGAFHGDTVGAVSLGGVPAFRDAYGPLLFDVLRAPDPDEGEGGWERVVGAVEGELARSGDRIAGVVVEPVVQGAAGMRLFAPELLARLREATTRADTFLVCDEVFSGYGRVGAMWASSLAGVTPDLLCTAKGFSGGMLPMAATLATDRIWEGFRGGRALMHGHTFGGNALGAAVAREVLAVYRDEDVIARSSPKAAAIAAAFDALASVPGVRRVRARGLVGAADLGDGGYDGALGWRVYDAALRRGAVLRPLGDTVYVTPALNIADADLATLLTVLDDSVREVLRAT